MTNPNLPARDFHIGDEVLYIADSRRSKFNDWKVFSAMGGTVFVVSDKAHEWDDAFHHRLTHPDGAPLGEFVPISKDARGIIVHNNHIGQILYYDIALEEVNKIIKGES